MKERGFKIFAPEEEEPGKDSEVFYNDKMILNRDLSEAAARVFRERLGGEAFEVCDALAGSGIRGFRYSDAASRLLLNDANPSAVESIERGLEENSIGAEVRNEDANIVLSENRSRFHLIDIDPFGPFTPFLDSACRASSHNSFAGFTATDNAVAAGTYTKTCRRRYGAKPLKNSFMHETALRIYIRTVFENFARYDNCFEPKACFQERHYCRVMGRVTESKQRTNNNLENIGWVSFCAKCRWRDFVQAGNCPCCGSGEVATAGPLWTGKFVDSRFTSDMLEEIPEDWKESREFLELLHAEGEIKTPFYDLHMLASSMGVSAPKREPVIEAIREKGYPVGRTHFSPTGFRTDAPLKDIKQIISTLS